MRRCRNKRAKINKNEKWNGNERLTFKKEHKSRLPMGDMKGVLIYPLFFENTCFTFSYRNRKICTHRRSRRRIEISD